MTYLRAHTIEEALARLARHPRPRIVCGATDAFADAKLVPARFEWTDISGIDALRGIEQRGDVVRIGAATSFEAMARTAWLPSALRDAAAAVGPRQIRVKGTLGGNLCHASPVADSVPALLVLGAQIELASLRGVRRLPLSDFLLGNRRTALDSDELLVAVSFSVSRAQVRTAFVKCTNREGMAIAVASAAVHLRLSTDDTVEDVAIAVGGASPVPLRVRALEAALCGRRCAEVVDVIEAASLIELSPIDDCRATASHRLHLARLAIMRAFKRCIKEFLDGIPAA